jgi:site-specific DNA-methyltransferase (adenine-specific)
LWVLGEIKLFNNDCLIELENLIKQGITVNSVITDIPYGTTQCPWDSVIEFEKMWDLLHKICPNGPIVLFAKQPFTSNLIMSNPNEFREIVVWLKNKSGNGFSADQRHIQVLEDIVVFSKNSTYTFNPQKWLISDKEFITQRKTFEEVEVGNNIYGKIKRTRKVDTGERNPINIVSCRVPFTPSKSKTYSQDVDLRYHPTQKPLDLMEYLVKTFSNEDDIVLDFTMGSGTTGVACKKLNRGFIGIEKDIVYYDIAKKRISEV